MKPLYLLLFILVTGLAPLRAGILVKNLLEATNASSCDGGFTLEASGTAGPFNVTLTGPSNQNLTGINGDHVFTNLCSGTYNIHVFNAFGCDVNLTATVLEGRMTVSINGSRVTCGEAANLVTTVIAGLAPYTYAWSNGATTANLSTTVTSTYGVTVTDSRGMTATASHTMGSAIPKPTLTFTSFNQFTSCTYSNSGNPELTTSTSGTANINFTTTKAPSQTLDIKIKNLTTGANVTKGNSINYQFLKPGNHEFTLSVVGGPAACTTVYPFYLGCCQSIRGGSVINTSGVGVDPVILQSPTTATSYNGSIKITTGSYTFQWANGSSAAELTGLGPGEYCVYANSGCGTTEQFCYNLVNCASSPITISSTQITPTCSGQTSGGVSISTTSGRSVASYLWSNGATTKNITNVAAGQYCVTVTEANTGCKYSNCFTVNNTGTATLQNNTYNVVACTEKYTCNGQTVTKTGTASYTVNTSCQFTYACTLKPGQTTVKNGSLTVVNSTYQGWQCYGPRGCYDAFSGIFFFQSSSPYNHINIYFEPTSNYIGSTEECSGGECTYDLYCGNNYVATTCGYCSNLAPGEVYTLDAEKATIAESLWSFHKAGYLADTTLIALPVGITPFTPEKEYRAFLESTAGKDLPAILWRAPWEMIEKPRPEALKVSKMPTRIDESGSPLVEAWPNPFNDVLNLRFADKVKDEQHFSFMDVLGRVVWEGTLPKMDSKGEVSLRIPDSIAAGVYFVRVGVGEQNVHTFKLNRIKN